MAANSAATAEPNMIHIKVSSQSYEEILFKVKKSTVFEKIIEKYCDRFNISNRSGVRFIFDGETVNPKRTPEELRMEDGDAVECVIEQVGGFFRCSLGVCNL